VRLLAEMRMGLHLAKCFLGQRRSSAPLMFPPLLASLSLAGSAFLFFFFLAAAFTHTQRPAETVFTVFGVQKRPLSDSAKWHSSGRMFFPPDHWQVQEEEMNLKFANLGAKFAQICGPRVGLKQWAAEGTRRRKLEEKLQGKRFPPFTLTLLGPSLRNSHAQLVIFCPSFRAAFVAPLSPQAGRPKDCWLRGRFEVALLASS